MTPWHEGPISDAAREQQKLWGGDAAGWARFAEPHTRPLFEAELAATRGPPGTRLLDVGCGHGPPLAIAQARGAAVTGLHVTPAPPTAAPHRAPRAQLLAL